MNTSYSKEMVIITLQNYIKQIEQIKDDREKMKYSKIYEALKDSLSLLKSLSDMNVEESNEYFRLLMASISASIIIY